MPPLGDPLFSSGREKSQSSDTLALVLTIVREQKFRLDQVIQKMDDTDRKREAGQVERKAEVAEVKQMIAEFKTHYEKMKNTYDFVQSFVERTQKWGRPLLWGVGIILSAVYAMLKIIDWFHGHKQ